MKRRLSLNVEAWPIAGKFVIARGARTQAVVVECAIGEGDSVGRGECVPYARYGETVESVSAEIETVRRAIETGETHAAILAAIRPGAARNAVDCALWDLAAKESGVRLPPNLDSPRCVRLSPRLPSASALQAKWPPRRQRRSIGPC